MQSKKTRAAPDANVVFETTSPLYFSFYSDGAFEKRWLPWKALHFVLRDDATLTYSKYSRSAASASATAGTDAGAGAGDGRAAGGNVLDLSVVSLEKIPVDGGAEGSSTSMSMGRSLGAVTAAEAKAASSAANASASATATLGVITDVGVRVTCTKDGLPSEFRCVFPQAELMQFLDALYGIRGCRVTNLRDFKRAMEWDKANVPDWIPVSSYASAVTNPLAGTFIDPQDMSVQMSMSKLHHSGGMSFGTAGDSRHEYASLDGAGSGSGSDDGGGEGGVSMQQRSAAGGRSTVGKRSSGVSPSRHGASSGDSSADGRGSVLVKAAQMLGSTLGGGSRHAAGMSQSARGGPGQSSMRGQTDGGGKQFIVQQSAMRRAITKAMDQYDYNNRKAQTIARRGAFKWLPVAFTSDLVHGSWWFVGGAIFTTLIAVVILLNSYYPTEWLGHDNSYNGMPLGMYRVTWMMLSASGLLYVIGSLAFVRAVSDPPMQPLFPCSIHTATDELLGSWLFFWGTVPSIPYAICYLYWYNNKWYLGMLAIAVITTLGTYLFVLSCYPSVKGRTASLLQALVCVCGRKPCILKHCANDWLAGTWIMYYATLLGTIACAVLLAIEANKIEESGGVEGTDRVESSNRITLFIYATTLLDYVGFLIGSMYFVSGSYPYDPNATGAGARAGGDAGGEGGVPQSSNLAGIGGSRKNPGTLDAVGEGDDENVSDQSHLMDTFNAGNLVANGGIV